MDKTKLIVDRIENGIAVCEVDGATIDIPLTKLSGDVREGDILCENGGLYAVAKEETAIRRTAISDRFERLKARQK